MIVCDGRQHLDEYDVIDRIATLSTSTLANALDDAGYHGNVMQGMHSVVAGSRFAGPAVTVRESSGEFGSFRPEDFRVGEIIDAAKAGDVIVIDGDGTLCSTWVAWHPSLQSSRALRAWWSTEPCGISRR